GGADADPRPRPEQAGEPLALLGAQGLRIGEASYRPQQNDRGGDYRPGERAAPDLVDPGDQSAAPPRRCDLHAGSPGREGTKANWPSAKAAMCRDAPTARRASALITRGRRSARAGSGS